MTNTVKNSDKGKYVYIDYGIAFDGKCSCSFNIDSARNNTFFGVHDNWSSHTENLKNDTLVLSEGDTFGINGSFSAPGIKINKDKILLEFAF